MAIRTVNWRKKGSPGVELTVDAGANGGLSVVYVTRC